MTRYSLSSLTWLFAIFLLALRDAGVEGWSMDRRSTLQLLQVLAMGDLQVQAPASSPPGSTTTALPTMPNVEITDKVFMDVRISRQDGSTYVRDDLPDTFENRVLFHRLVFGLYGKEAPNHVQKFLSYIVPPKDDDVDNPYPSYGRSAFKSLDQETGLLQGGTIPSLRVKDIGGSTALQYGARVLPANFWFETKKATNTSPSSSSSNNKLRLLHSTKGLLTHKTLDVTPAFGITTRASPALDGTHTVFGQVIWDESTVQFFRQLEDLPTYSMERPAAIDDDDFNSGGAVASLVFNAQRELFRGAAKSLGDTRVDKLYNGKLLRRFEVNQVGIL
jgi:cyclophilin family peptidyl-prolyl cis-trans isomerase